MGSSQSSQSKSAADLAPSPPADAAPTVVVDDAAAEPTTDPAPEHGEHDGEPLAAPSLEDELARLRELARKAMPSRAQAQQTAELEAFAGKRPEPAADECVRCTVSQD